MGYDVHLHRADSWTESASSPISREEWFRVVESDPELRLEANSPDTAQWTGPCRYPEGTWFAWEDGRVFTKNPDRAILAKLLQLAQRLEARVQGDEGEFYRRPEDLAEDPAEEATTPEPSPGELTPEEEQRLREANETPMDISSFIWYVVLAIIVMSWIARLTGLFR